MAEGYKDWSAGDILTAADLEDYTVKQSVMVFADASARTTALSSVLREGMVSYLKDTDSTEVYDGSAWAAVGAAAGILQVVSTTKTDTFSTTSATYTGVTGLTATIAPSSATSKILVIVQVSTSGTGPGFMRLSGGNSANYEGDSDGASRVESAIQTYGDSVGNAYSSPIVYLDSPATTSPVTYGVDVRRGGVSTYTIYVNRSADDSNNTNRGRMASSITVMEVSA